MLTIMKKPAILKSTAFIFLAISSGFIPSISFGYDFYLKGITCKTTGAYLVDRSDKQFLRVGDGDPMLGQCTRRSKKVRCDFISSSDKQAGGSIDLDVSLDSPPYLYLTANNGGEFIAINTSNRQTASITRIVDTDFLASKVCSGMYFTEFELQPLDKKK